MTQLVTRHYGGVWVPRDGSERKRMRRRALRVFRPLVPALPERGVRADGFSVATRHHN